jgi:hypothetical protein
MTLPKRWIFYHKPTNAIYCSDSDVNAATPADLANAVMIELVHAWLYQHLVNLYNTPINNPVYENCFVVAKKMMGLEK